MGKLPTTPEAAPPDGGRAAGHERRLDLAVAGGLAALVETLIALGHVGAPYRGEIHGDTALTLGLVLGALSTLPLYWRRRHPLPVLVVTGLAAFAALISYGSPGPIAAGPIVALYTVATVCERWTSLGAVAVALCGVVSGVAIAHPTDLVWAAYAFPAVVIVAAWLVGDNLRVRRAYLSELEHRAARAEADRDAEAARAADEERARIARELHDVVAHHVSMIAIQAGAARLVAERSAGDGASGVSVQSAQKALSSIESAARQALAELRRLLGVLRHGRDGGQVSLTPQPGLRGLDDLVSGVRDAGLPVDLRIEGTPFPLVPSAELSAYRIVQESLTNVLKHEGAAPTEVTLRYGATHLEVEIVDSPSSAGAGTWKTGGHGIAGMRERVALFGGELDVGTRADGSFGVLARFPLEGLVP